MELAGKLMAAWLWAATAAAVAVAGLIRKMLVWLRAPVPLPMPLPPAPATWTGVVLRMLREGALFETLFRANRWTWLFGWLFHAACCSSSFATPGSSSTRCRRGSVRGSERGSG